MRKTRRIADRSEDAFENRISDALKHKELIRGAWKIELSLKNDLGIFRVEYFDPDKMFKTYEEIDEFLFFIDENQLMRIGIGFVDVHILTSAKL